MFDFLNGQPWYIIALASVAGYISLAYIIALVPYLMFYKTFRDRFIRRKIQKKFTSDKTIKHELRYSFTTLLIHSIAGVLIIFLHSKGYTQVYTEIGDYGYLYFIVSIPLMLIIHDTYFYWTHRFMHLKAIYPRVHKVHHVSVNPSPWAAYSGHPWEALIAAGIFPILAFIIPCHPVALIVFVVYMLFMSVMGHAGFEFYSKTFPNSWFGKWQTTATHHNLHHKYFFGNYGIYFNFWDKVMKTERENYMEEYQRTFEE